jgi:hypothetical protein
MYESGKLQQIPQILHGLFSAISLISSLRRRMSSGVAISVG